MFSTIPERRIEKRPIRRSAGKIAGDHVQSPTAMGLVVIFCLGVLNFAAHKAVLESGHSLLGQMPWAIQPLGGRLSLLVEFAMLLGAMIMVAAGSTGWAWLYALYSIVNGLAAWLIFSGRA